MIALLLACQSPSRSSSDSRSEAADSLLDSQASPWNLEQVSERDMGLHLRLALSDQGPVLAAFANAPEAAGTCEELGEDAPERLEQPLYVASRAESGWEVVELARPLVSLSPPGLDLAVDASGQPAVAWSDGEPVLQPDLCIGHDGVLARRGSSGWETRTYVQSSDEAYADHAASDAGHVVGWWPALGFSGDEALVLYRDAHFGSLQGDDLSRADAELARGQGSSWSHEEVDPGRGAQRYGDLAVDPEGRVVVVYVNPVQDHDDGTAGVWAAREGDSGWDLVQLSESLPGSRLEIEIAPDGDIHLAWYEPERRSAVLARLAEPELFASEAAWSREDLAEPGWDEGDMLALELDGQGEPVVVLHRCGPLSDGGCDPQDEGLWLVHGQYREEIHRGELGSCGDQLDLALDEERLWVGFRCLVDQGGLSRPSFVAWRPL